MSTAISSDKDASRERHNYQIYKIELLKKPFSNPFGLIQHCERSELFLHFERTKVHLKNVKKNVIFENLKLTIKQWYQTKIVEKCQNSKN